jgi:hypothetical protein
MSMVLLVSDGWVSPELAPQVVEETLTHPARTESLRSGEHSHGTAIRRIMALFGCLLCFGVGALFARYAASLSADEFDLRVDALYETSEDLVVRLRLETTKRQFYVFWSPGIAHEWNAMPLPTRSTWYADNDRQGELFLFCSTVFAAKEQRLKTILGDHRDHRTVPGSQDYSRLRVTIPSGRYPLNTPLLLGRLDGRDVYLAVGEVDTIQELRSRMPRRESTSDAIRPGTDSRPRFTPLTPASAALWLIPSDELDQRGSTPGRPRAEIAVPVTPGLHEGPKETPRGPVSPSYSPTLWPWSGCRRRPSAGLSKWDTCKRLSAGPDMASG